MDNTIELSCLSVEQRSHKIAINLVVPSGTLDSSCCDEWRVEDDMCRATFLVDILPEDTFSTAWERFSVKLAEVREIQLNIERTYTPLFAELKQVSKAVNSTVFSSDDDRFERKDDPYTPVVFTYGTALAVDISVPADQVIPDEFSLVPERGTASYYRVIKPKYYQDSEGVVHITSPTSYELLVKSVVEDVLGHRERYMREHRNGIAIAKQVQDTAFGLSCELREFFCLFHERIGHQIHLLYEAPLCGRDFSLEGYQRVFWQTWLTHEKDIFVPEDATVDAIAEICREEKRSVDELYRRYSIECDADLKLAEKFYRKARKYIKKHFPPAGPLYRPRVQLHGTVISLLWRNATEQDVDIIQFSRPVLSSLNEEVQWGRIRRCLKDLAKKNAEYMRKFGKQYLIAVAVMENIEKERRREMKEGRYPTVVYTSWLQQNLFEE